MSWWPRIVNCNQRYRLRWWRIGSYLFLNVFRFPSLILFILCMLQNDFLNTSVNWTLTKLSHLPWTSSSTSLIGYLRPSCIQENEYVTTPNYRSTAINAVWERQGRGCIINQNTDTDRLKRRLKPRMEVEANIQILGHRSTKMSSLVLGDTITGNLGCPNVGTPYLM